MPVIRYFSPADFAWCSIVECGIFQESHEYKRNWRHVRYNPYRDDNFDNSFLVEFERFLERETDSVESFCCYCKYSQDWGMDDSILQERDYFTWKIQIQLQFEYFYFQNYWMIISIKHMKIAQDMLQNKNHRTNMANVLCTKQQ